MLVAYALRDAFSAMQVTVIRKADEVANLEYMLENTQDQLEE